MALQICKFLKLFHSKMRPSLLSFALVVAAPLCGLFSAGVSAESEPCSACHWGVRLVSDALCDEGVTAMGVEFAEQNLRPLLASRRKETWVAGKQFYW